MYAQHKTKNKTKNRTDKKKISHGSLPDIEP